MKGMQNRIAAAAATILFMAAIRTDAQPQLWQMALITVILYEGVLMAIQIGRAAALENQKRKNDRIRKAEGHRWAEEWFNPYKGVRA